MIAWCVLEASLDKREEFTERDVGGSNATIDWDSFVSLTRESRKSVMNTGREETKRRGIAIGGGLSVN